MADQSDYPKMAFLPAPKNLWDSPLSLSKSLKKILDLVLVSCSSRKLKNPCAVPGLPQMQCKSAIKLEWFDIHLEFALLF